MQRLKPRLSLEIGTYKAGSLQVISELSHKVVAVDIDKSIEASLAGRFGNVEFRIGDSGSVVPDLVAELNLAAKQVDFVLIDGDHSAEGVRRDIDAVLGLAVRNRMVILMHDGFNPDCRRGMLAAAWQKNPHVRYVEIDYSVGNFHSPPVDTALPQSMWGGFACALLEPGQREGNLTIRQHQRAAFETIYAVSAHAPQTPASRLGRLAGRVKRRLF